MTTPMKESATAWPTYSPASRPDEAVRPGDRVRLVFVDDDDNYREVAGAELVDHGFDVVALADGTAMLDYLAGGGAGDVIVLDWNLPTTPGIDLLPKLQRRGIHLPIVFLTGQSSRAHENLALERGALDFVDKSRGVGILAKRIRLIVDAGKQPQEMQAEEILQCGRLVLRPRVSRAYWNDVDVNLTLTEFNIVRLLASSVGEYVTYRSVYDCMHHVGFIAGSGEDGYRTNVRSSIKRIRNKFRAIDTDFGEIENFPSFGYRWGRANTPAA
ncbi:MAG TPA: response regulator transcription factor [Vineibacter sp.]|nr:response regulator transcription factor [Vineibacter sp.]